MKPGFTTIALAIIVFAAFCLVSCSSAPLVSIKPDQITDTSSFTIVCNAEKGNKGLKDFNWPVYIHLGLITDSSVHSTYWRYVKFNWGSADHAAMATPVGKNKWSFHVTHLRKFFGVAEHEKIQQLAILFRQGNCIDTLCKTLRNEDKTDILIPVQQTH